jgi:streptogramin lyase
MLSSQTCSLVSNGDTLNVTFNPTATDFAADASYYPYEFDLYDYTATTFTASNSLAITTPPCVTPNPICVYSPPALQELVANGGTFSHSVVGVFNPTFVSVSGATIWTDLGVISATAPAPTYALYSSSVVSNQSIAALEVPGGTTVFAPDYSGASPQLLDDISPTGTLSTSTYPPDTNTLNGAPSGAGIILGPDGNLWWIDPVTGVLRYANPSSPSVVTSCLLQPPGTNVFLTAAQIVPTPSGVSPSRIWFSAVDNFGGSPGFTYLGYVNVPASGSNSCGSGQTGQYAAFDKADYGTPVPPNGLAVDGSGNAWYNDGDIYINSANATAIGEATVGSTGAVTVAKSVLLPGQNTPGDLGYAGQAWGLVYDPLDGNLYFATDNGLIGRFNPTLGLSSVAAYALPSMLANLQDSSSGPSYNDAECFAVPGPCNPQLVWDPGTSSKGRLTFTTLTSLSEPYYTTTTAQLDLGSAAVGFSSEARSHQTTRTKRPHHRIFRTYGRRRTAG